MNYKNKYIKYKNKYLKLKNISNNLIIFGGTTKVEIGQELIKKMEIENISSSEINNFYNKYYKNDRICEAKNYITKNRKDGKKIMAIIGSIPLQKDKFIINDNYVPIYFENDITMSTYLPSVSKADNLTNLTNLINKTFEDYPVLFIDFFETNEFISQFDLIIFDTGTCKWLNINKKILLSIFKYTYDNSSIIVLDNIESQNKIYTHKNSNIPIMTDKNNNIISTQEIIEKKLKLHTDLKFWKNTLDIIIDKDNMPKYYYWTSNNIIFDNIYKWLEKNFKNILIQNVSTEIILINLLNQIHNITDNQLLVYFYNKNLYYNNDNNYGVYKPSYIYFTNTKIFNMN